MGRYKTSEIQRPNRTTYVQLQNKFKRVHYPRNQLHPRKSDNQGNEKGKAPKVKINIAS